LARLSLNADERADASDTAAVTEVFTASENEADAIALFTSVTVTV
jgi:hypothetical protein